MYGAEQGRERRDVSWRAEAPERGFPSPVAIKTPQRQPWRDGKGKCPKDRSAASAWGSLPPGQTFRWSLQGATEHLGPRRQSSGSRLWAAKGWRDLGIEGFGSWSWGSGDREGPVFQPRPWHPPQWGKGCSGWVRTRSRHEDRPPCSCGKGDSAQGMPQLPKYKDESKKALFVCWFSTTSQYGFSWCLAGEGPHPIIISRHWCNSHNIECRLYGNSLGAFIFAPGNLLMTVLVVNTVVRNDFKRFPWDIIVFLPAKCLPTLVTNATQRWRSIFCFLIISLLYAFR